MKRALRFLGLAALCGLGLSALAADNVAKVGTTEYATIDDAVEAWGPGKTLTLLQDVTLSDTVVVEMNATKSTSGWTLNLGDYTMTAATGKDAIKLFATGGTQFNNNNGLKINATEKGGINAANNRVIAVEYSPADTRYRPRLEFNGGHYVGSYIVQYGTASWGSYYNSCAATHGPGTYFNKGTDGKPGVYDGKVVLCKSLVQVNAGTFNGDEFSVYPVSSTGDTYIYGGKFKSVPTPYNNKGIFKYGDGIVYFYDNDGYYEAVTKASISYEASLPKGHVLKKTSFSALGYNDASVYFAVANVAVERASSEVTLYADADADKSFSSSTSTMFLENGAKYTGTITLGTSAKLVVKDGVDGFVGKVACSNSDYLVKKTDAGSQYTYSCISKKSCPVMIADPSGTECYYVDSDEINAAIAAAASGSTIEFKDGTYTVKKTLADGETLTLVNAAGHYDYATLVKGAAACDLTTEVSEDGKTVVIKSAKNDAKCQAVVVDADDNPTYYATFADAVKGAAEKGTVSVNREIAAGEEVVIAGKEVTLDLAGQVVKADILFTGDKTDFIIDSVGGGKVLGKISVDEGCTLKIYAGTFNQEIPAAWIAAEDAEGNPLCVVKQDDGTFKVIANKVEVKEIEITEQNVKIVDEKGETVVVPEEKVAAAQAAIIEANTKLQEAIANVPPVDTGIEKAAKEAVVTPSGEVVAGAAKANVVGALQEALKEAAKTEDIPVEAANQITASSDISERLEIKVDSEVTKVNDSENQPDKMEANLEVVVWDVKPIVKTVITIGEGEGAEEKIIETQLPDEEVKKNPVTFRLAVSDPKATGAYVKHIGHGEYDDETIFCKVQGPAGGRYVELTVDHFSLFEVRTTGEVVEDLDDAIGIINLGVPGAGKELAAGVPFTTAGTTAKLDDLVMTGLASGDKILVQKAEGEGYDEYTFNGTTWGNVELAPGTTFWYQSVGSSVPLTLAGLVTNSVSTAVAAGTAAAPKATLLVNPFNSAADLVVAVGAAAAEGDQIAFAGDNGGKDVRYVFKGGQWGYYTKPAAVTAAGIYLADDVFNPVSAISVPGGKGAWYVSKGGNPTVAWSAVGAAVASEQIAASDAQTYGALDWFVALNAADMDSFEHEGIRLVGYGADGEVFRYGRDFTADAFAASNTVFLGLGGGTGAAASFAVELLDADDNVIAVSESIEASALGNALTATYAGSKAPVTATEPVQFANFGADDNGEFAYLREAFAGKGIVKALADGCEVSLTNDVTGPVTLAANLGAVTLDLNGHSITGTVATVDDDAGSAIVIDGSVEGATLPTVLTVANTSTTAAKIAGGAGADGIVAKNGAVAIVYDLSTGVTVNDPRSLVSAGENGVEMAAWAWCTCATAPAAPVDLPYGVSYDSENEKYLFWERNDADSATFDFAKVAGWDITDGAIHFIDGTINVDQFVVPAAAGNLTFIGGTDTTLAATAGTRAFDVTSGADDVRAWTNLTFTGSGIAVTGGKIEVAKCAFDTCASDQFGGAIAAHALSGESTVVDSTFTGCFADDGGAIFATGASASGVTLKVVRSTFTENMGGNGGAISTQTRDVGSYALSLDIANSTFLRNQTLPGCSGGAIAAQGNVSIDADATVETPGTTVFQGNFAGLSGGAIDITFSAKREGSSEANDAALLIGRGVKFIGNSVTGGLEALGGAISIDETPAGCKYALEAEGVLFKENIVTGETGAYEALGGAIFVYGGTDADDTEVTVDTCVFDGNGAFAEDEGVAIYGGALEIDYSTVTVKNSTFRNSNIEAAYFWNGDVAVTNCVAVGNNTAGYEDSADLIFDSVGSATMSYSAYGKVVSYETTLSETDNLANRPTTIYDGDSLKLNPAGFNPVAVFGLTQEGVRDFEGTQYGYDGYSWSMGAFETVTVKLTVTVTGDREYNGNMSSNGIAQFGFALSTNGVAVADDFCAELGDVKNAFSVTEWKYGAKDVGFYASTNAADTAKVIADVALVAEDREVLLNALDFIYEGTISPTVNGLAMTIEPLDYAWTGSEIVPTSVTVIDTLSGDPLVEGTDYRVTYGDNVDPTDSAKVIVTGSRNYYGGTAVSNFWITAYTVNHVFDDEVRGTEMFGATGGQAVVGHELAEIPAGYCFDWQNSVTNKDALKIGEGGLTAIDVLYWTDSNGDKVPDKFQKKITAKVVNGEWDEKALSGVNQTVWVTLATEDGTWDAVNGTGAFGTDHASHALPPAGSSPDGKSQALGGWIAFAGGDGYVVTNPAELTITADMTPILLYGYLAKTSTSGGRTGRGAKGGTTATEPTLDDLAKQYKVAAALTSFSLDSAAGTAKMAPKMSLMNSGKEVEPIDLKGSTVTIRAMETLGGPAEEYPAQVGPDGNVTVPAEGPQGFYQLAE